MPKILLLLVILGTIVVASRLLSARIRRSDTKGPSSTGWPRAPILVGVLLLILILPVLLVTMNPQSVITRTLAGHYASEFAARTGLDRNLLQAIFILLMIPATIWIKNLFSWDGKVRARASRNLTLGTAVYYLALFLTTPLFDTASGEGAYVLFRDGHAIRVSKPIHDPYTGEESVALTPELVRRYPELAATPVSLVTRLFTPKVGQGASLQQPPKGVNPEFWPFFDPNDGHARVYYEQVSNGRIIPYTSASFSPLTGDPLREITGEVVALYVAQCQSDLAHPPTDPTGSDLTSRPPSGETGTAMAVEADVRSKSPGRAAPAPKEIAAAKRSARMNPKNALLQVSAAEMCAATGDVQGAREYYERALALDPANSDARRGMERLGGRR